MAYNVTSHIQNTVGKPIQVKLFLALYTFLYGDCKKKMHWFSLMIC